VQITGLLRFRQPFFLDITYTRRYVSWFLPGTFVFNFVWHVAAGLTTVSVSGGSGLMVTSRGVSLGGRLASSVSAGPGV
jgi:hypothetical protein